MRRDADQDLITHMPLHGMLDMPVRLGPNARGAGTYPWGGLRLASCEPPPPDPCRILLGAEWPGTTKQDNSVKPKSDSYSADQIKVLEGLDAVRKRPAMYIGSTGVDGLHHLVYEVVDNSVDEHMAGFGEAIEVTIHIDGSVTVVDNGRNIPPACIPHKKKSAAEVALTVPACGRKNLNRAPIRCPAVCMVSASRSSTRCPNGWSWKSGRTARCSSNANERGKPQAPLAVTGKTKRRGTKVRFKPDGQIFETLEFSFDVLAQQLRSWPFSTKAWRSRSRRPQRKGTGLPLQGGIVSFVDHLNEGETPLHKPIYVQTERADLILEVALQYNDGYAEILFSFANNINTKEGGTHLGGLQSRVDPHDHKLRQRQ